MANKEDGEISIRLDRVRVLKYDFNAFAEFEDRTGKTVPATFSTITAKNPNETFGFSMIRSFLWAGLIHEDPELTMQGAGKLIDQADGKTAIERLTYVSGKVNEAISLNFDQSEKNLPEEPEKKAGTGTQS
jgi:hypothetical protein